MLIKFWEALLRILKIKLT